MIIEYPYVVKGFKFMVRPHTWDSCTVDSIIVRDEYSLEKLAKRIPNVRTIVDIGGHIGSFVVASLAQWPSAQVSTFEAYLDNYTLLCLNTREYPSVRAFHYAVVGDSSQTVRFQSPCMDSPVPDRGPCTGGCFVSDAGDVVEPACNVGFAISSTGTDHVDLLKIDCEGSEEYILPALKEQGLLSKISTIIGEWHKPYRKEIVESILKGTHDVNFIALNETEKDLGLFEAFIR